ncbi:Alpha/Beta hydrolase protein [Kalaharituber pfeilii]|nr:Alpha/Beta hydrolase protein [Kalaharituber pfeilii]
MVILKEMLLVILSIPAFLCDAFDPDPIADLGYAMYQGTHDPTTNYSAFFGMRFAAPPLGNLRFHAPRPPPKSRLDVILDASKNSLPGTVCPQGILPGLDMDIETQFAIPSSEDCLTLTVYAPSKALRKKMDGPRGHGHPVVVYIHAGGYTMGDQFKSNKRK